jgi:ABC-type multidrug transport system fused ATPase/permease subunit
MANSPKESINPPNIQLPAKLGYIRVIISVYKIVFSKKMVFDLFLKVLIMIFQMYKNILYGEVINSLINNYNNIDNLKKNVHSYFTLIILEYSLFLYQEYDYSRNINPLSKFKLQYLKEILYKDLEFFDFFKPGEILSRYSDDFEKLNRFNPENFSHMFMGMTKVLFGIFYSFNISWQLALLQLLGICYDIWRTLSSNIYQTKNRVQANKLQDEIMAKVTEAITNIRVVKSFSNEEKLISQLREKGKRLHQLRLSYSLFASWRFKELIQKLIEIIQIWYSGVKIANGEFTIGNFTTFQLFSKDISNSFSFVSREFAAMLSSIDKAERIFEIYNYKSKIQSNFGILDENKKLEGEIEFKNVYFNYPLQNDVRILKDFNLKIKKGEVVAIVGASGAGKSTIASLLQRFYDVTAGELLIDEKNIKEYNLQWLHRQIGFVAQEPALFADTIENNITYGCSISEYRSIPQEELDRVAKLSNAYEFITNKDKFPEGYRTLLGNNGLILSGGQKQRIAIARALLMNSKFLIFDEATSALDADSENEVQSAINNIIMQGNITTIIIAHRLSTIKNCKRILVLKDGSIVEEGSHKQLIERDGLYKHLVEKQLEKPELKLNYVNK